MKKFLFLVMIPLIISCTKKDNNDKPQDTYGSFVLDIVTNDKLSTGEVVEHNASTIIHVWKADGKSLEIRSSLHAINGYAFDFMSGNTVKADYTFLSSHVAQKVPIGNYLVYVMLDEDSDVAKLAWSYTFFDVTDNQTINLKKAFTTHAISGQYEAWDAAE